MSLEIPAQQPVVPVITGGDLGAYSLAREYHEARGWISAVVPTADNLVVGGSSITEVFPAGPMFEGDKVVAHLEQVARTVNAATPNRPLILHFGYDHLVRIGAEYDQQLRDLGYHFPRLSTGQLDRAALKEHFYALCDRLGVPYPRTLSFDTRSTEEVSPENFVRNVASALTFPIVLKADDGGQWANTRFEGRRKVHFFTEPDAMEAVLTHAVAAGYQGKLIVQEFVPGPDSQLRILTVYRNGQGQVSLAGLAEVIVEDHAPGLEGNSRALLSARDEEIAEYGIKITQNLDWHGFAMFDVKVHAETRQPLFLEMNPRLGRHHYYLTAGGVNPVELVLADLVPEHASPGAAEAVNPAALELDAISLTIPFSVAKRYANSSQQRRMATAKKRKKVFTPLQYRADAQLKRDVYQKYRLVKAAQEVQHQPGTMNS